MDKNEELLEILKPFIAIREEWFPSKESTFPEYFAIEENAQRIDYLLGATIAAYQYVIQKSQNESDIRLTEWHCRYKATDSEIISFYTGMHCWELSRVIEYLCFESKRVGQRISTVLARELLYKQLELCRLMVNYSIEGDIWRRVFSAALSLTDLIDIEEEIDGDASIRLTHLAQWITVDFDLEEKNWNFTYPRFEYIKNEYQTLFTRLGVGIDVYLRLQGHVPLGLNESASLVAIYDEVTEEIITIRFMTSSGIFYRERGFWWNYGHDVGDFFDELGMIQVSPEFVERFDLEEERGRRVKSDELTYNELSSEELYPDD